LHLSNFARFLQVHGLVGAGASQRQYGDTRRILARISPLRDTGRRPSAPAGPACARQAKLHELTHRRAAGLVLRREPKTATDRATRKCRQKNGKLQQSPFPDKAREAHTGVAEIFNKCRPVFLGVVTHPLAQRMGFFAREKTKKARLGRAFLDSRKTAVT
jgi:hypothetical protein